MTRPPDLPPVLTLGGVQAVAARGLNRNHARDPAGRLEPDPANLDLVFEKLRQ